MFFKLFAKECGQMLKSLIYYLFLAAVVFFYVSQVGSFTTYSEPLKGQEESYGIKASSDKQQIMGARWPYLRESMRRTVTRLIRWDFIKM